MRPTHRISMDALKWTCKTYLDFPLDPVIGNAVRGNIPGILFSRVTPTPLQSPVVLAAYSADVLENILDLSAPAMSVDRHFVGVVSGCEHLVGVPALAHRYGGHQFGQWAGQLGDGRAMIIGEYVNNAGDRWEMQLKGAGLTPYSRFADGRAVIRSSVREFLCSEAMYHLGVPTSRAGTLTVCEDTVTRDQFYDGRPREERLAVVLRLAPCWFRFGSLAMAAADGNVQVQRLLADHLCEQYLGSVHLPHHNVECGENYSRYVLLASAIAAATGRMIARWDSVGFTHGVMNTDNMSVLGLTIDYGPFGFMEEYNADFVPNTSDTSGLYRFANQRRIGQWNVLRLIESLLPLFSNENEVCEDGPVMTIVSTVLGAYSEQYVSTRRTLSAAKLGVPSDNTEAASDVQSLYDRLLQLMHDGGGCDFTATFRQLGEVTLLELTNMVASCEAQCSQNTSNHMEKARAAETRDKVWAIRRMCQLPLFARWLSDYQKTLQRLNIDDNQRRIVMCAANPRYVLRNWLAQRAIEAVEKDEFEELNLLQRVLQRPFTEQAEAEKAGYSDPPPGWSKQLKVSCSS